MKKIVQTVIALILTAQVGFAAVGNIDDKNKKITDDKKTKRDDTTKVVLNSEVLLDSVDSLLMFPSHDLYGSWDTTIFHPSLFAQFEGDSSTVYLLDDWNCGFTLPIKGVVTSDFGWRRRRPHFGTDINLETGDTVAAAFDGRVRIAKFNKSYGNVVIVRHNNGLETVYAHLSKLLVEPGQEVSSGDKIGLGGNTGHSFGSHLHFEIRYLGKAIDAEDVIDFEKGEVKNEAFVVYKEDFDKKYDLRALHNHQVAKSHGVARHKTYKKGKGKKGKKYYASKKGKGKAVAKGKGSKKGKAVAKAPAKKGKASVKKAVAKKGSSKGKGKPVAKKGGAKKAPAKKKKA